MARRYRPRKLFKFWLYHDLVGDSQLMDYIKYLRQTRQFAKTVRNGLRLMWTLGEGDLSVLFELFPGLQSKWMPRNDELIEQFRQMLLQQQARVAGPVPPTIPALGTMTGAQIAAARPVAMPTFNDDDDQETVILKRAEVSQEDLMRTTNNFLASAFGVIQGENS